MKLRSFGIKNFKSLEDVSVEKCFDFQALIGANSSGKTSIFDALNIIKKIGDTFTQPELISKGIGDFETKSITLDLKIELADNERRDYLIHDFQIEAEFIDDYLHGITLKNIHLEITINIYGSKVLPKPGASQVFPSLMEISTESGNVLLIRQTAPDQVTLRNNPQPNHRVRSNKFGIFLREAPQGGNPVKQNYHNVNLFSGRFLVDLSENLRYVVAIRETHKKVASAYFDQEKNIGQRGEQLVNFMETLWTNDDERYRQIENYCKSIFPNIEKIRPKKLPNNEIIIQIHKKNINIPITLDSEGRGLDQALVLIWRIATSPENTIWLVDEPEIHLHPGAQKLVYEFFQNEISRNKQIIVATHSMVFIHRCKEEQISILLYKDGLTELSSIENIVNAETVLGESRENIRSKVYEALGYDSSQSLEYTTIVAVEGKTDKTILKMFAEIIEKPIDEKFVQFIPMGNKNDAGRFTPILKYAVSKRTLIILDNDYQNPEELKQSLKSKEEEYKKKIGLAKSLIKDDEYCFYNKEIYSIESYLLNPNAIGKVGNLEQTQIDEIDSRIRNEKSKEKKDREKPKVLLSNIWSDFGLGNYDDESPVKIVKNMTKFDVMQFPEIVGIIDKINGEA